MNKTINFLFLIIFSIYLPKLSARLFTTGNVPDWKLAKSVINSGKPLFLTPFVDGHIERGRRLSRVDSQNFLNITSYSGYLTVDEDNNSNLWFWFFPAEGTEYLYDDEIDYDYSEYDYEENNKKTRNEIDNTPLILWLQGGPGASSLFGLFTECGPFFVKDDGINIEANKHSWHKNYSIIFIDNPVGTGFSFTDKPEGYATNVTQISKQLYNGMVQFLKLFPWLQYVPLYIVGESFAGKYIPGIGYEIHEQNKESYFKINLQGLAMGNAFSDPYNMLHYSDFAYQTGLVDMHGRNELRVYEVFAKEYIFKPESKIYWDSLFYSFLKHSRYDNLYHILRPQTKLNLESYLDFVNQDHIRKALHVGNQEFSSPFIVYYNLIPDFMTSAMPWVESLLEENVRIMYYSGNLDFIVAYPLSENSYKYMKWSKINEYRDAERKAFMVNGTLAGYIKKASNFAEVVILNAGHMVPTDQPEASLELIQRFINDEL